jgi:hypothetical protein
MVERKTERKVKKLHIDNGLELKKHVDYRKKLEKPRIRVLWEYICMSSSRFYLWGLPLGSPLSLLYNDEMHEGHDSSARATNFELCVGALPQFCSFPQTNL